MIPGWLDEVRREGQIWSQFEVTAGSQESLGTGTRWFALPRWP
jgi:hypothetical protein